MPKNFACRGLHSNPLYPTGERPLHTVTADPRAKLVSTHLTPMYNATGGQRPRTRSLDRPLMTVTANKPAPAMLTSPSLLRWSHGGATLDVADPMPTIATEKGGVFSLSQPVVRPFIDDYEGPAKPVTDGLGTVTGRDRFALVVPELWPWGLDVRYRMLQPSELKQAQGFPEGYEITGTKTDRTKQIGNAVPVHMAKNLCKHVLTSDDPSLASYGGGITADEDVEIPDYHEVATDGGVESDD
jgi:DNA (cytosine-5)-methyltransferase 1